jgi:predicted nucleic acid-binding protein
MYLFDTDILSNIVKPKPSQYLLKKIKTLPKRLQFTTSISIGEIYYGAYRAPNKKRILEFDLRIASIALRNKLTLITGNVKHFRVIPKLKIENWIK